MPPRLLSVQSLDAVHIIARADSAAVQRGRSYYYQGRAKIIAVHKQDAMIHVRGNRADVCDVLVQLEEEGAALHCDCEDAENQPGWICAHKVAAALALSDHLRYHPIVTWESQITKALSESPKRTASSRVLLFFSLQKRASYWGVYLYNLPASHFPAETWSDPAEVAKTVKTLRLSAQAKQVRSQPDSARFVNATHELRTAAHLSLMAQHFYYYASERTSSLSSLFPLLKDGPLFLGTENNPLRTPLHIHLDEGSVEVEMQETPDGLRLTPTVRLQEKIFPLHGESTQIVSEEPLWILRDADLFRLQDSSEGGIGFFMETKEIVIPKDEEELFLERYLPQLAVRLPIAGEAVKWQEVEAEPTPRVYLSETDDGLKASLRFAYGDYEVPYDKRLPESDVQRHAETRNLVRIHRKPEIEEERWHEMSGFGLKRGEEPGDFVLRVRTDPVDFLLHHVPSTLR